MSKGSTPSVESGDSLPTTVQALTAISRILYNNGTLPWVNALNEPLRIPKLVVPCDNGPIHVYLRILEYMDLEGRAYSAGGIYKTASVVLRVLPSQHYAHPKWVACQQGWTRPPLSPTQPTGFDVTLLGEQKLGFPPAGTLSLLVAERPDVVQSKIDGTPYKEIATPILQDLLQGMHREFPR